MKSILLALALTSANHGGAQNFAYVGMCPADSHPAPGYEWACYATETVEIRAIGSNGDVLDCAWVPWAGRCGGNQS